MICTGLHNNLAANQKITCVLGEAIITAAEVDWSRLPRILTLGSRCSLIGSRGCSRGSLWGSLCELGGPPGPTPETDVLLLLRSTRIGDTVAAEFRGLTWVEFRPLSVIDADEAVGVVDAEALGDGPFATPPDDPS